MSRWRFILASLWHYRWLNLAVLAGVALTSAILSGSLAVGDSVRESLRRSGMARISGASLAVVGGERFFTGDLARRLHEKTGAVTAPVLQSLATVSTPSGEARANQVQLAGIDDSFWEFATERPPMPLFPASGQFAINEALASRLGAGAGDRIVISVEPPGLLSKDAPLSGSSNQPVKLRGTVSRVLSAREFGHYNLNVAQVPAPTLFLPLSVLQERLNRPQRVNVILLRGESSREAVSAALEESWTLADASLRLQRLEQGSWQLTTDRVFLEDAIAERFLSAYPGAEGILSYLVNAIRAADGRFTPYSMAAARVDPSLAAGEAVISDWLAEDLGLQPGDAFTLDYFVMGNARRLAEQSSSWRVARVEPLAGPDFNRSWTPEFPGISDAENNADWEPGMPFHRERIRKKDEDYWDAHRTTPKVFLPLAAGQELWGNRFGKLTAIRFPASAIPGEPEFLARTRDLFTLADHGVLLRDLRQEAESAVAQSYDLGSLFAGMSFFLIAAALTLTALLFLFGIEQRRSQVGLLLALGHRRSALQGMFLGEAALLALAGACLGLPAGVLYTKLALEGLGGAWRSAAGGVELVYQARPASLLAGASVTFLLGIGVVALACRSLASILPSQLLTGPSSLPRAAGRAGALPFWGALVLFAAGAAVPLLPRQGPVMAQQGAFFGGGFLLVLSGLLLAYGLLGRLARRDQPLRKLSALGLANASRRRWRSLSIVALMSSGVFMVTAINSLRLDASATGSNRASGTGGFDFLGESTLPIYEDLNSPEGRAVFGLEPAAPFLAVPFRASDGDDASCLNLNRAQRPRLLGVNPERLQDRFFFSAEEEPGAAWSLLREPPAPAADGVPVIPGILDQATAQYALGLKLGSEIEFTASDGKPFRVRVAGFLDNSVLQGNVVIAEEAFLRFLPSVGGYRFFLIQETSPSQPAAAQLTRQLEDRGLELLPAWRRLNEFNAVQNTYLSIFSLLGGLGLVLATAGLAIVVSRNILERRPQLALLQSLGFRRSQLAWLVVCEHWFLHAFGVATGVAAGIFAVLPTVSSRSTDVPLALLIWLNGTILTAGLVFCWLAARGMLRGNLVSALRQE